MKNYWITLLTVCATGALGADVSPYAGQETRQIKALSAGEVASYLAGEGMGLARPAELNGYPGPRHVLDMAERLGLTDTQRAAVQKLFDGMKESAVPLGKALVAREAEMDALFAGRRITEAKLATLTADIGRIQGELRAVHLRAHLAMVRILTEEQIRIYQVLRGYTAMPVHPGVGKANPLGPGF